MEIGAVLSKTEARQKNSRVKKFKIIALWQSYGRFFGFAGDCGDCPTATAA
jgi:hypothetical protein